MRTSHIRLFPVAGLGLLAALLAAEPGRPAADAPARSLKDVQKERVEVLTERVAQARKAAGTAAAAADTVLLWEERLAVAQAEMDGKTAELRKLYERRLAALRDQEQKAEKAQKAGALSPAEVLDARYARLEAELALARLK